MSREIKRVPLDFGWPLNKVWVGFFTPDRLLGNKCPDCKNGYSPRAQYLFDLWYGYVPFSPMDNGSTPLTRNTPAVHAVAERNVKSAPHYYGSDKSAVVREAIRLISLWNSMWCHHLNDDDVAALVEAGRLMDFTHTFTSETRWQPKDPPVIPTAAEINEWSIQGFGHDSTNASVVIRARCEREGVGDTCPTCDGRTELGHRAGRVGPTEQKGSGVMRKPQPCAHGPHLLDGNGDCVCGAHWSRAEIKAAIDAPGGEYPGQPVWDDEED